MPSFNASWAMCSIGVSDTLCSSWQRGANAHPPSASQPLLTYATCLIHRSNDFASLQYIILVLQLCTFAVKIEAICSLMDKTVIGSLIAARSIFGFGSAVLG